MRPAAPPSTWPGDEPHVLSLRELRVHCSGCGMRELCLPVGLDAPALARLDALVGPRSRVRKGQAVYRAGERFHALYAVWVGSIKTTMLSEDGREQVAGYHLIGEIVGLDGIGHGQYCCTATALEDCEVCVLPFDRLEAVAREVQHLQRTLHRFLSREIERDHHVMLLLGSMTAEERLAAFLLDLAKRYRDRGFSASEFLLRMTREEIGSLLGLKLETVSRLFSRFQGEGLIQVQGRAVKILDFGALRAISGR
jgi:CRP/FNR family transcriptional regulator